MGGSSGLSTFGAKVLTSGANLRWSSGSNSGGAPAFWTGWYEERGVADAPARGVLVPLRPVHKLGNEAVEIGWLVGHEPRRGGRAHVSLTQSAQGTAWGPAMHS